MQIAQKVYNLHYLTGAELGGLKTNFLFNYMGFAVKLFGNNG